MRAETSHALASAYSVDRYRFSSWSAPCFDPDLSRALQRFDSFIQAVPIAGERKALHRQQCNFRFRHGQRRIRRIGQGLQQLYGFLKLRYRSSVLPAVQDARLNTKRTHHSNGGGLRGIAIAAQSLQQGHGFGCSTQARVEIAETPRRLGELHQRHGARALCLGPFQLRGQPVK